MEDERFVRTEDVYHGPRREAVEAVDRDIDLAEFGMNLSLDMRDYKTAYTAQQELKTLRLKRHFILTGSIHDVVPKDVLQKSVEAFKNTKEQTQ